jgi:cell division protein FtsI/penicillin-binding protein 2
VGTSGLEKAFDARLAGTPGGELLAVDAGAGSGTTADGRPAGRTLASSDPVAGQPVRTTIDPELQEAAFEALAEQFGGIAVLDARKGSVLALAGIAYSTLQPPGSTFKIVTTVAALEGGQAGLDDTFPFETTVSVDGREIDNSDDALCGGSFSEAFAKSCNTVFAPLGAEIGGTALIDASERFGWNEPPTLFDAEATAAIEPPTSTIPDPLSSELEVAVSAIGQGKVQATPLQMASVAQTIAAGGVRSPTPLVKEEALRADAQPVTVTTERIAASVRELMVDTVTFGTGGAAALPSVQVAGKTGTAELRPKEIQPEEEPPPEGTEEEPAVAEEPVQEIDAWFTGFAPAERPRIAIAVMIANAEGGGGAIAAPIAAQVLAAWFAE